MLAAAHAPTIQAVEAMQREEQNLRQHQGQLEQHLELLEDSVFVFVPSIVAALPVVGVAVQLLFFPLMLGAEHLGHVVVDDVVVLRLLHFVDVVQGVLPGASSLYACY